MSRAAIAIVIAVVACAPTTATPSPTATVTQAAATAPTSATPAPASAVATTARPAGTPGPVTLREFPVPAGSGPHDVAPATDGGVWYTAQRSGELGWLDPKTGQTKHVRIGPGSSPHGVIVGPDGAPWITDSGLNAIVRVDPRTSEVKRFPLPGAPANLNTAVFDGRGVLWFTGQNGYFGRLDPSGQVEQFAAPGGRGPYGITVTPTDSVYYASLAGDHIARIGLRSARSAPRPRGGSPRQRSDRRRRTTARVASGATPREPSG